MVETEPQETPAGTPSAAAEPPPLKVQDKRRIHLDETGEVRSVVNADEAPGGAPAGADAAVSPSAEEAAPKASSPASNAELERLNRELEAARRRVDELARGILAGEREREAFKARLTREREQLLDVERGAVAVALLEAIDELDLCVARADDSPLVRGVRLIRDNLLKKAEATGIERVELTGQKFDPNLAEASDMELTPVESDDGKVIATVRGCYRLKGRVIRPGTVRVAKYVKPADA